MLILLLTSSSALIMSAAGFTISDWLYQKNSMIERLNTMAGIIGSNSVAAITFGDPDSTQQTLSILREEGDIVSAALFNLKGEPFASYQRDNNSLSLTLPDKKSGFIDNKLFVVVPILLESEPIGHIMLLSDLSYWKLRQLIHLFTAAGVLLISLVAALIISSRMQRVVSEPILKLAETARQITEANDYSMRAERLSSDEIGCLVDDFNGMLDQIQVKDSELQKVAESLEEKVESRTQALTKLTEQLEHQAYHDALTGLANRTTFDNHLKLSIEKTRRYGGKLAVLFLDLDRFKIVNDTLGHTIGDKLLIEVAKRFSNCMRASDTLARLGGDEFGILLASTDSTCNAIDVAQKLREVISEPIEVEGYCLHPSTSIGISMFPDDGDSASVLLKNADAAMYRSKDSGRNQISFFSPEMNVQANRRLELENKLRHAVREGLLQVHYQPRCDAVSRKIIGVEALARWNDPQEGYISPAEFIPLAEECGLIGAIDEWTMQTACRDVLYWHQNGCPDISLAVNFSPVQFARKDPHDIIKRILEQTGFRGDRLELEITESLFGPDSINVSSTIEKIRELGIKISVDDFGTAYSSLSRLKQLPLHTLKIDQSFVRDLGKDQDDGIIVRTIITMAHNLNLNVVAEGVETEMQYNFVKQHGCDVVQGYLFGKPAPAKEIEALLLVNAFDTSADIHRGVVHKQIKSL